MTMQMYRDMLAVMAKRGGPYSGADIPEFYRLVEELFTPEEAEINNALTRKPIPPAEVARQVGRDEESVRAILEQMADKGLCMTVQEGGERLFQGLPFMPGIFEYQFVGGRTTDRDRKIAHLIQAYKRAWTKGKGIQPINFPTTRVITVDRKIKAGNRIHTYDQVATYIERYETIGLGTCYCRHAALLRGEDIHGMPNDVCMWFGPNAEYAVQRLGMRKVSKEEAKKTLARAEAAGLIHMSRNTAEEIDFLCNCDRWNCEVVKLILRQPKPGLVFNSGFQPTFDPQRCTACETCIDRCPAGALKMGDGQAPVVDLDRCFGCAVCASGCPEEAILMEAKPGWPEPPKTARDLGAALRAAAGRAAA